MEPLKEMFNVSYFKKLTSAVSDVYPLLDKKKFFNHMMVDLDAKSLNERMRYTTLVLRNHLPDKYKSALTILDQVIQKMPTGYTALVFPDYVGQYGLDHPTLSLKALKNYTRYGSSEFAIRQFLLKDFDQTIHTMYTWAGDADHHVRRLSSEGSRPRLPWSFKLDVVIKKPELTAPILNLLHKDTELYVRKSVANHLNDISKEHPDYLLNLISTWDRDHDHTAWIIKHGCRTLIKKGHQKTLSIFNVLADPKIIVEYFKINPTKIRTGECLDFTFTIRSLANNNQKIIIDYIVYYVKSGGGSSPKVFKLKEFELKAKETLTISKKQRFIDFSTRVLNPGLHKIELQINGKIMANGTFSIRTM